jgi:hypothetical protein
MSFLFDPRVKGEKEWLLFGHPARHVLLTILKKILFRLSNQTFMRRNRGLCVKTKHLCVETEVFAPNQTFMRQNRGLCVKPNIYASKPRFMHQTTIYSLYRLVKNEGNT